MVEFIQLKVCSRELAFFLTYTPGGGLEVNPLPFAWFERGHMHQSVGRHWCWNHVCSWYNS